MVKGHTAFMKKCKDDPERLEFHSNLRERAKSWVSLIESEIAARKKNNRMTYGKVKCLWLVTHSDALVTEAAPIILTTKRAAEKWAKEMMDSGQVCLYRVELDAICEAGEFKWTDADKTK